MFFGNRSVKPFTTSRTSLQLFWRRGSCYVTYDDGLSRSSTSHGFSCNSQTPVPHLRLAAPLTARVCSRRYCDGTVPFVVVLLDLFGYTQAKLIELLSQWCCCVSADFLGNFACFSYSPERAFSSILSMIELLPSILASLVELMVHWQEAWEWSPWVKTCCKNNFVSCD